MRRLEREITQAESSEKRHGRLEHRKLQAATTLAEWLQWPGARQVCRMDRTRTVRGKTTTETVYAVTSLGPAEADAQALLAIARNHWGIENRLHLVRDVSLGEDACRVRSGSAPQVLAALRNTNLALLRRSGYRHTAAAQRHFAAHPDKALALVLQRSPRQN